MTDDKTGPKLRPCADYIINADRKPEKVHGWRVAGFPEFWVAKVHDGMFVSYNVTQRASGLKSLGYGNKEAAAGLITSGRAAELAAKEGDKSKIKTYSDALKLLRSEDARKRKKAKAWAG